jgi:peptidoglycan lytic transglycosylase D
MREKNTLFQINLQYLWILCFTLALFTLQPGNAIHAAEVFTTPENLKDNVAFWKKIYTEVSLKQGIIHDREYPLIIYKTVNIGTRQGRSRRNFIRKHITEIKLWLSNINKKPAVQWSAKEQEIAILFQRYASLEEAKNAKKRIRHQQGQKERFKDGLERSGAYLPHILAAFLKHKVPPRIAFLPHVESSFNTRAYSRVGAAGMWQFMRRTGRLYLKINYRIDERFDPFKASEAAAKLLKQNYSKLKSWPLAITAYNHGLASITRSVRVTGSRDLGVIIDKYKNRRFKFASKNFYGCFLAASEIAANPYKYFTDIDYHSPPKYHEITLKKYYRPKTLAKYLGISQAQIRAMNPSLRSIVFRRQLTIPRNFKLRIPVTLSLQAAREKLGSVPATKKKNQINGQHYYSVNEGDTLYGIARRFRVSTDELIIANEIDRKNRIYIGQVLRIPGRKGKKKKTIAQIPKIEKKAEEKITQPLAPTPPPAAKKENSTDINQNNQNILPKSSDKIVKSTPQTDQSIFDATLYSLKVKPVSGKSQVLATVSLGETLGHYADWLGTSVRAIRNLNRGRRNIRVHQKIRIPIKSSDSLEQFNARRLEYHMAQEEDFYNNYKVADTKTRKVEYGDTLWSICQRDEEIPIWLLKKFNRDINLEALKVNVTLTIPILNASN